MSNQLTQFADSIAAGAGVKRKKSFSAPVRHRRRGVVDFPPQFITLCDLEIFFDRPGAVNNLLIVARCTCGNSPAIVEKR
jgi:hypothetical protein